MFNKHRHYGRLVVIWAMLAGIPLVWLDLEGWVGKTLSTVQLFVMMGGILMLFQHGRGPLCEKCIDQMPLNGQEKAAQRRGVLKAMHTLWDGHNLLWFMLVIIALSFASVFIPSEVLRHTADTIMSLPLVLLFMGYHVHERLQPWCPFCRWGRGDEDEESPAPTPAQPSTV